ncbi:hypothetical protein [Streptomyces sp. V1I6]|uniref:hypothetical protein n=1 Tax=Streptomyces sp. V1I6 TaxID=3042273 RepID=UPI0027868175|nr:hypothetical protein [Streptomyces sp. V1I6]MDQ0845450.1 hypothetical protein [Streptomyces sp. V1I6]
MSDEKQPATPPQPPKEPQTAAEHIADQQKSVEAVKQNLTTTDGVVKVIDKLPSIFGLNRNGGNFFGSSSFENTDLNRMLDILDSAVPSELENAGDALQKANEALNKAAKELDEFVRKTDWKGEGATAFQKYSAGLVQHAWDVSKYANTVGAQMKVASTGLTTVRNSKPPRDSRAVEKRPNQFSEAEKTPDNPDYQKAVAVEKDRQEAINLMNRLASYYAVSRGTLASQPEPQLPEGLNAAVPRPRSRSPLGVEESASGVPTQSNAKEASAMRLQEAGSRGEVVREPLGPVVPPRTSDTSMQIDSVAPPQSQTVPTGPTTTPPVTGPTGQTNTTPPFVPGIPANPVKSTAKATGQPGVPRISGGPNPTANGRTGQSNGGTPPMGRTATGGRPGIPNTGPTATGRSGEMMGRPTATGGPTGRAGGPTPTGQGPMAGRPSNTGQPGTGRAGTSGPTGTRGRADGIIGGTPQRATTASSGPRVPRGNVIGADGPAQGRSSAARPGQSGVVGGSAPQPGQRPARPGPSGRGGVVGTPRDTNRGPRPGAGGYTTGGAAVLGGRRDQRRPEDDQDNTDSTRPDYLTEDEETWAARRRPAAPPVID